MRGRKPTPDNVLRLRGTMRADRHGSRMRTECAVPDMPDVLDERAANVWKRTVPLLKDARAIAVIDQDALARYCIAQALWEESVIRQRRMRKLKEKDALTKLVRALSATSTRMAGELGLTPASRNRVRASAPDDENKHAGNTKTRFFNAGA